jgi:hypothetical protein
MISKQYYFDILLFKSSEFISLLLLVLKLDKFYCSNIFEGGETLCDLYFLLIKNIFLILLESPPFNCYFGEFSSDLNYNL